MEAHHKGTHKFRTKYFYTLLIKHNDGALISKPNGQSIQNVFKVLIWIPLLPNRVICTLQIMQDEMGRSCNMHRI